MAGPFAIGAYLTGVIGYIKSANMNSSADQQAGIGIGAAGLTYRITEIIVTNASISLTTAAGGIYTAASKGGTAIVAAGQAYSALTTSAKVLVLTIAVTDKRTESILYFSLTTAQGSAATADLYFIGYPLV